MAVKLQFRRDTAANWVANNPLLLNGEIGIETDTLKFKVGNGFQRWNAIEFYAFKVGAANGIATLDSSGKVPSSQLPIFENIQDLESAIQAALSAKTTSNIPEGSNLYFTNARVISALNSITTTNIAEGSNLYFTNERAIQATQNEFDPAGAASQAIETAGANAATKISELINSAPSTLNTLSELASAIQNNENYVNDVVNLVANKQDTLTAGNAITIANNVISVAGNTFDTKGAASLVQTAAAADATTKANAAIVSAAADATSKANSAKADAIATAAADATTKANAAITSSSQDATTKANAAQAAAILAAAADATSKANLAESAAITAAATDATTKVGLAVTEANSFTTQAVTSAINLLSTSDIEEGSNQYFTVQRAKDAVASDIANAIAEIPAGGPGSISSTTDLPEGNNLYFTNARAVTATNAARTNILLSALSSVDDLRTEIQTNLTNYIPVSDINVDNGVVGLDSSSKIQEAQIPSTIARLSNPAFTGTATAEDIVVSGNLTVTGTTTTVNTANFTTSDPLIYLGDGNNANLVDLGFVGSYNDGTYAHQGLVKDSSDGKWKLFKGVTDEPTTTINFSQGSLDALAVGAFSATSAAIGSVTNAEIQRLSGLTSGVQSQLNSITSNYATSIQLTAGINESKSYTDTAINGISNSLDTYALVSDRNTAGGYAGLDLSGKILTSAIPAISNAMLTNSSITINGSAVSLGASVITGYTNGISGSNVNKITYGTSATPPATGNSAGDIYIQY